MKKKSKVIVIAIFILAIIIRVIFINKENISKFQFDFGIGKLDSVQDYDNLYENFDQEPNKGRHINYIMHLYTYNSLSDEIIGQFYHPPLHHFIMATYLKIADLFLDNSLLKLEGMQYITVLYSVVILISLYKILKELDVVDKIVPMLIFAFYPLYIFMSGLLNNDELVTMFSILALLYLIRWDKNPTMKNTIKIAICIGLGLMTKSSMMVMIIPAIFVYFRKLNKFVKEDKDIKYLLLELLIFSIISGILGLSFHIISLIQGKNTLGIIEPYEYLSIADKSLFERFGIPNIFEISQVNIWNYLLYSSISFLPGNITVYNFIMAILTIILVIDAIYYVIKNGKANLILIVTLVSWWISYFTLNISMPYTCSMHSRYMAVPISISAIFLGIGISKENSKILKFQVYLITTLLSIMSILIFV